MSVNTSDWLSIDSNEIEEEVTDNLIFQNSSWLNNTITTNIIANNIEAPMVYSSRGATPYYIDSNLYEDYTDSNYGNDDAYGNSGSGGYYDNYSDGYDANIYLENGGYDAYAQGSYSDYSDYSDYGNYSKTMIYFYWTKDNDAVTQMTGSETGSISPWAMAVQVNTLIGLVNTHASKSIATVNTNDLLTATKYNEIASALGVANVAVGTKITVQHFYQLQTAFNAKKYYVSS